VAEPRVLIVEDDPDIADLVEIHLGDLNVGLDRASDGETGLELALSRDYRLVILDLMLPKLDGLEVLKRIRRERETLPILLLTAKGEELDKVVGLELGADDYVTKPFSIRELMARVKGILRRTTLAAEAVADGPVIETRGLRLDLEKRRVSIRGKRIELTAKEFDLLTLFARHPGKVFSRNDLLDQVWGYQFEGYGHTVNSHINRLRSKIEVNPAEPGLITTVWGVGYRFAEDDAT
jgi:DNA-binding response OmpR family regulator